MRSVRAARQGRSCQCEHDGGMGVRTTREQHTAPPHKPLTPPAPTPSSRTGMGVREDAAASSITTNRSSETSKISSRRIQHCNKRSKLLPPPKQTRCLQPHHRPSLHHLHHHQCNRGGSSSTVRVAQTLRDRCARA